MSMANQLEAVLGKVKAFNEKAEAHKIAGDLLDTERDGILAEAKELGLKHLKTSAMLAKVSTKLKGPEDVGQTGDADFSEV